VFICKQTNHGYNLHLVPPELSWNLSPKIELVYLLMNFMPNELTNSVNDGLHPASAERSDGSLWLNCWDFIGILIGCKQYKDWCGKGNLTPFAFPYNGDCTNIFLKEDVHEVMVEFKEFLLHVFDSAGKTLLCLQAVQAQLIALLGGEQDFCLYVKKHPETFFSVPSTKEYEILRTCHPEFLLNKKYRNEHTPFYATRSDLVYTIVHTYLDDQVECTTTSNIIEKVRGSAGFEILVCVARERNERNGKRQIKKMKTGMHPWQVHAKTILDEWGNNVSEVENVLSIYESINQSKKMKTGMHNFQVAAKKFLDKWGVDVPKGEKVLSIYESKRQKDLLDNCKHNFQAKGFIEESSKRMSDLSAKGKHNFQKLLKETIEKRDINLRLARIANAMDSWDKQFELFKSLMSCYQEVNVRGFLFNKEKQTPRE
jgi:hypothetical protein